MRRRLGARLHNLPGAHGLPPEPPSHRWRGGAALFARRHRPQRDLGLLLCHTVTRSPGPAGSLAIPGPAHRVCPFKFACSRSSRGPQAEQALPRGPQTQPSHVVVVGSTWHRFQLRPRPRRLLSLRLRLGRGHSEIRQQLSKARPTFWYRSLLHHFITSPHHDQDV